MKNLLTSSQIRDADARTIAAKSISSADLMEAACVAFVEVFKKETENRSAGVDIFCGTGNNGGDGLAVARLLHQEGYTNVIVKIARFSTKPTADFNLNLQRLKLTGVPVAELSDFGAFTPQKAEVIIDALLGSGLNRAVEGHLKTLIEQINDSGKKVISIDVPSGFLTEGTLQSQSTYIRSNLVVSFQRPKINFFFPESADAIRRFVTVPIGLDEAYIEAQPSSWKLIEETDIRNILNDRKPFSHKGTYGHALLIAGSNETMGAALLCADACLHSGAGLTTACIPPAGLNSLNTRSPEIMALIRTEGHPRFAFEKYSAIAIGPGLGTNNDAYSLLKNVLDSKPKTLVLDADALNMLSSHPELLSLLPSLSVLTPHMKEFDRMFGEHISWWDRLDTARKKAAQLNVIILLKNQYSFIVLPDGNALINPTGNPAMAVGGMGDVLTGMIASFLAQGYPATDATVLACYLHGKTGDELRNEGMNSIPPRYLIEKLPHTIASLAR